MKSVLFFVLTSLAAAGPVAQAEGLFYNKCDLNAASLGTSDSGGLFQPVAFTGKSGFAGLSCQDLKATLDAVHIVGMTLMPVSVALNAPGAKEMIAADLAAYGLTLANPAVLGVTVVGAVGVVTVYFVMRSSLEECEAQDRQKLRDDIIREVKASFGASSNNPVPLEILCCGF